MAQDGSLHAQSWALVVDDHPLFCDALELTLRTVADYATVKTANSLKLALAALAQDGPPALILLDLNLPDVDGLGGLMELKRAAPSTPVIIVSSMNEQAIVSSSIAAGAQGFVPKHSHRSVFRDAIAAIAEGEIFKPADFVDTPSTEPRENNLSRLSSLTAQQARILDLICEGKLNKQIAYDLSIAETTVKAHVTAIMRKLNVQSRTQAVLVAQEARFTKALPS